MLNQKFFANILFLLIIALASTAKSQNYSDDDNKDQKKVLSIMAINIIFDNKVLSKNSNIECKIEFIDDYNQKVNANFDENSNFIILESNPGKVFIKSLKCSNHSIPFIFGKSRFKTINDYGFVAFKDFINYAGHITINYNSSFFKTLDLLNLSSLFVDNDGVISLNCDDKIFEAISFINSKFKNLYHLQITKTLMNDSFYLKPNEKAVPYDISNFNNDAQKAITSQSSQPLKTVLENNINNAQTANKDLNKSNFQPENLINSDYINSKSTTPQHQYLAPYYSEFYAPIYNPYFSIVPSHLVINAGTTSLQDPIIENPH